MKPSTFLTIMACHFSLPKIVKEPGYFNWNTD